MSSQQPASLEFRNSVKRGLRVEFHWTRDRFSHTIFSVDKTKKIPLLLSVEGSEEDLFPSSPCFTELHEQDQTLFLTGATAACHWSMSVEVAEHCFPGEEVDLRTIFDRRFGLNAPGILGGDAHFLSLDVACRFKAPCQRIGSEYRAADSTGIHATKAIAFVSLSEDNSRPGVVIGNNPIDMFKTCNAKPECMIVHEESTAFGIAPASEPTQKVPATMQWRYGAWMI